VRHIRLPSQLAAFALLAAPAGVVAQNVAPGFNGYFTLGTAYWNRGLAQTDEGIAVQFGVDYQHRSGFFTGAEIADVDYEINTRPGKPRELVVDAFFGYHHRQSELSWTLIGAYYAYPDTTWDYDYAEIGASVGFRDRLFVSAWYSDDFLAQSRSATNVEVTGVFPLRWNFELSATLGRFDLDLVSATEFTHWNLGVSKLFPRVALDLRYNESTYGFTTGLGDPGNNQLVLSASYAFRARSRN
jgi:uncharacterized protein (TIGR02001 family)